MNPPPWSARDVPPAYEHVVVKLAFKAVSAKVINITSRDESRANVLYQIVFRPAKLSPFKPHLDINHIPSSCVVGQAKIQSLTKSRQLAFPQTKKIIVYKDSYISPHGNGNIHWYLTAPAYESHNAIMELRRADKHRTPICRVILNGGLGGKNGSIDVLDHQGTQEALNEIIVSTAAEIWDPYGKGQGEKANTRAQMKTFGTVAVYERLVDEV